MSAFGARATRPPSSASDYPIEANSAPKLLEMSPTGKGSNWVEMVSFD
jgi:hypothetical protein